MPEFILDHGSPDAARAFNKLDSFTQGYIEAMFFTDATSDNKELEHATVADLSRASMGAIKRECREWQEQNAAILACAYVLDYEPIQAGRDYWFTRNGHGVGFWDRKVLTDFVIGKNNETNLGDVLSERATSERSIYRGDDKRVHYGPG